MCDLKKGLLYKSGNHYGAKASHYPLQLDTDATDAVCSVKGSSVWLQQNIYNTDLIPHFFSSHLYSKDIKKLPYFKCFFKYLI